MNKTVYTAVFCLIGAFALLSFRNNTFTQNPWKAPASADTIKSRVSVSPQVLRQGETLYQSYCVSCHGKTGLGDGSPGKFPIEPANFHNKAVQAQTDGALFWKLSTGKGVMPAYSAVLTEEMRWQLISYIRQIPKRAAPVKEKPALPLVNYRFDSNLSGLHAPIPLKLTNAVVSDQQVFMVDTIVEGLTRPWSMSLLPDGQILIGERAGQIQLVKNGRLQEKPLKGNIPVGLRDVKIHPDFKNNKLVYLSYYQDPVERKTGYTVLMRAKLSGAELVDPEILYKAGPMSGNGEWYGSKIAFDAKGYLFFTVGIRGARKNAQDLSSPEGKTMRFNDDGTIPSDNPFVNTAGALPEIYSYGHRVHEGIGYDPVTGRVLSTEFGELGGDELNVIKAGANYGWPLVSHSLEYNGNMISKSPFMEGVETPLHHFAVAPSDFDVTYSDRYPKWKGNVFIGGLAAKAIYRLEFKADRVSHEENMLQNIGRVRDVKMGRDGLLYLLTEDTGLLLRLLPIKEIKFKKD